MEHSVKTTNAYVYEATLVTTVEQVCLNPFERQNNLWYCILHDYIIRVTVALCLHWTIPIKRQEIKADINIDQAIVNVNFVYSSQSTSW